MSPLQFNLVFVTGTLGIFFATVLYQEVHIPFVSTQKLIIPCPPPPPGSTLEQLVELFDTSSPAQKFWKYFNYTITRPIGWDEKIEL